MGWLLEWPWVIGTGWFAAAIVVVIWIILSPPHNPDT